MCKYQRGKLCSHTFRLNCTLFSTLGFQQFAVIFIVLVSIPTKFCTDDAVQITAILGESVVFNCDVEFPGDHQVPYVLQWEKKGEEIPIYIWYDSYPTHSSSNYEGRVSRVVSDAPYGAASLNLTNIRESDQGWYECNIVFLNRSPNQKKNGTWFYLNVHAPPRFITTPDDIIYVSLGDAIILTCQATGTPKPEILWLKDDKTIESSGTVGIFNERTELRISNIRHDDIGDYICLAKNTEGEISHTTRVIVAGAAVIMVPPMNQTKLEGEKVQFSCEAKAHPENVTVKWFREGVSINEISSLDTRVNFKRDGTLVINPVSADDSGQYLCEVSNGIGDPQSASAFLNVEYPAKVTFTPTVQYLPFRLAGVVHCYIKANPPLQYVTWTKDKRLLEPYQTKEIVIMNNGSLLFTRVNQNHQGRYTCTPYNAQGTQGSSSTMEVLVRKPPTFIFEPEPVYQKKLGESVEMYCEAQEAEGTQKPVIQWRRRDDIPLPKNRVTISHGNITIDNLRKTDFGFYQCIATNEVATIVANTQVIVEGTQPHAPYNITGSATEFSVTIQWLPGYSGGPDYKQEYTIWYREAGTQEWLQVPVAPSGSTQMTINRLTPGTEYEFRIAGRNTLGDGMLSDIMKVKTLDIYDYSVIIFPTDSTGAILLPPILRPKGPKPGPPRNVTVTEIHNGFLITWEPPLERSHLVQYYTIRYRTDSVWKTLNKVQIRPEDNSYLVKNLVGGRTYYFRILANSIKSYESSEEIKFPVPARVKHKAITAGVVGGFLFFIVAIILSICAVKICNKRKQRKQEKAYNMVACRMTEARNGATLHSDNQVPLKKFKEAGVSTLRIIAFIINWIWPKERCYKDDNVMGNVSKTANNSRHPLVKSFSDSPTNSLSNVSSCSDDGGFLSTTGTTIAFTNSLDCRNRMLWRKPLIGYPSQLSMRSDGSGQSACDILTQNFDRQPLFQNMQNIDSTMSINDNLPIISNSPSYFSDMSNNRNYLPHLSQLKTVHEQYSKELPSLRTIHYESYQNFQPAPCRQSTQKNLSLYKKTPELLLRTDHLQASPESQSSSSGFGSKYTSSHQNQSSSRNEPYHTYDYNNPLLIDYWLQHPFSNSDMIDFWPYDDDFLDTQQTSQQRVPAFDVGSVDGHYEFDRLTPITTTPIPSTPTNNYVRDDLDTSLSSVLNNSRKWCRYDDIDARVQAMKEEFHEFRKRQAATAIANLNSGYL